MRVEGRDGEGRTDGRDGIVFHEKAVSQYVRCGRAGEVNSCSPPCNIVDNTSHTDVEHGYVIVADERTENERSAQSIPSPCDAVA